jgi:uncharacterized protein YciI
MLYVITCKDKPDHLETRLANRRHHLEHLSGIEGRIYAAGPTLAVDGETMNGSVLIIDFPDLDAAQSFADADPYAKAGLFESVEISAWKKVLPPEK